MLKFRKLKTKNKLIYLSFLIIFTILILITSTSFAYLRKEIDMNKKITIKIGDLTYTLSSSDLSNGKVVIPANSNKEITINIIANNNINSKYELYYDFITSLTSDEKGNLYVGYTEFSNNLPVGTILPNGSRDINVQIFNDNDKDIEISFGVNGGYLSNELVLTNGISLNQEILNYYRDGSPIYFNPETGKICNDYQEENSLNENKSGCMKFYTFGDSPLSDTVNMILDHNTTDVIAWNESGSSTNGPSSTFLNKLKSDTDGWVGVTTRNDKYILKMDTINYTIDYSGYRARIISAKEVANAGGIPDYNDQVSIYYWSYFGTNSKTDNSLIGKYGWLYDRTNTNCTTVDCFNNSYSATVGYWTSTGIRDTDENLDRVRTVWYIGTLDYITPNVDSYGIRPVITVEKSKLYESKIQNVVEASKSYYSNNNINSLTTLNLPSDNAVLGLTNNDLIGTVYIKKDGRVAFQGLNGG